MSKTYYFKIEGRIIAENEDDAREQIEAMAITGINCEMCFNKVEEV